MGEEGWVEGAEVTGDCTGVDVAGVGICGNGCLCLEDGESRYRAMELEDV